MKFAQLALGASFLAGMMTAPAMAASYTTTGDTTTFNSDGTNTFLDPNADLSTVLSGDASAPGGNVELNDGAAGADLNAPANTLTANLDSGREVTFSSLTAADWFTPDPANGGQTFAQKWFGEMMGVYGTEVRNQAAFVLGGPVSDTQIFAAFGAADGFARLSDPNIAYVNESSAGVTFGLAAHSDAGNVNPLLTGFFASEVVKVTFEGVSEYYYSFAQPTASGQTSLDGTNSHEGNYEFFIEDHPPTEDVPEPASVLGLVALGGLAVASKRKSLA
jgi:hypothetical protein